MISPITWCLLIYVSIGLYILIEAIVEAWYWDEYETWIKVVGSIFAVLLWPLMFFI
jgi:hypothetical protein